MSAPRILLLALGCLALPPGEGLAMPAVARLLGATRGELAGLALLAASRLVAPRDPPARSVEVTATPAGTPRAATLEGTWRECPTRGPFLQTPSGPVRLALSGDVPRPHPGQEVTALARLDAAGRARAVALHVGRGPRGAWLDRWSRAAAERTERLVGRQRAPWLAALVLGRRGTLHRAQRRACESTGTQHLLALSGLHVSLVTAVLGCAAGSGRLGRRALVPTLAGFVLLSGARRPSLWRALVGLVLGLAGRRHGARLPPLQRLGVTALILASLSPGLLDDLGARLSFLAVAGLMGAARGRGALLLGPAGATLAIAPLLVETFGRVQPVGILVTPLLIPLVAALLTLALPVVALGPWLSALDRWIGPLLVVLVDTLDATLEVLAELAPAPLRPSPLPLPPVLVGLVLVWALQRLGRTRARASWTEQVA